MRFFGLKEIFDELDIIKHQMNSLPDTEDDYRLRLQKAQWELIEMAAEMLMSEENKENNSPVHSDQEENDEDDDEEDTEDVFEMVQFSNRTSSIMDYSPESDPDQTKIQAPRLFNLNNTPTPMGKMKLRSPFCPLEGFNQGIVSSPIVDTCEIIDYYLSPEKLKVAGTSLDPVTPPSQININRFDSNAPFKAPQKHRKLQMSSTQDKLLQVIEEGFEEQELGEAAELSEFYDVFMLQNEKAGVATRS